MTSTLSNPPLSVDSVVINELSRRKTTTQLLRPTDFNKQYHPHLYNYWTLNERLRSKNEKLFKIQQSACRFAFYSLLLFLFAGVMSIIVYRFTNDCSLITNERKSYFNINCLKHVLVLITVSISSLGFIGIVFGACRYFRSQPQQLSSNDECELRLTQNFDNIPASNKTNTCCCQHSLPNDGFQHVSDHTDEPSNITVTSSMQNLSAQRRIPPFTYEELPPVHSSSPPPIPRLPSILSNPRSVKAHHNKSVLFSSSTSPSSSSQQSMFSMPIVTSIPKSLISNDNNNKCKPTSVFDDAGSSTPTSYTTCVCATDVWERQEIP